MKTCERLRKIQWLDDYIESQMNQLQKLESQALKINASPLQADKVQNGNRKKRDDLYVELISTKEEIEEYAAEAMKQKRAFRKQIAEIPDLEARGLLQMVYIDRLTIDEICERKGWTTRKTYYVWLRRAEAFWKIEKSIFFFYGFTDFKSVNSCELTNSKGTCGNKMLQYVSINDKYKLNVIKYTTTVNAGNF